MRLCPISVHVDFCTAPYVFKALRGMVSQRRYSARSLSFQTWLSFFATEFALPIQGYALLGSCHRDVRVNCHDDSSLLVRERSIKIVLCQYFSLTSTDGTSVEAYPQTKYVSTSALFCPALTLTPSSRPGCQICRVTIGSLVNLCMDTMMSTALAALYVTRVTDVTYHCPYVHDVSMVTCVFYRHFVLVRRHFAV